MVRPRTFDEDGVLREIEQRFWDRGYAATSMSDLMSASGLGKGSLYAAFGDKEAVFSRVFDLYCDDAVGAVRVALDGPDESALDRLQRYLLRAATRAGESDVQRACFLAKTTAELAAHRSEIAERSRRTFEELVRILTACVESAQRAGDIDARADPVRLGRFLLTTLRGLEALAEAGLSKRVLLDAADTAIDVLR
ncbi:TetR/AcrR family transcriptional regulator [Amnibacterium soli]|uniref:TetR/AcrR family transcriptional regulator n=1 Tax=Amnibacterium soli TaxID=1282736 RepID=A0ABP8ZFC3_9MICO